MAAATSDASTLIERGVEELLYVFDRRSGESCFEKQFMFNSVKRFHDFLVKIKQEFQIEDDATFCIATTNRELIESDSEWDHIEAGDTLYILNSIDQQLSAQTHERVSFLPHYDTIIKGGMYEYYASEGHNPLSYALAELIDNSLAATAENQGPRNIEIRLHLDESNPTKNAVYVIDNGKGMTSRQLNNWAVYRLSKFIRNNRKGKMPDTGDSFVEHVQTNEMPRSLNSDISYFGVGGKQAIFFIGSTCRMISRPRAAHDVHELVISKEDFQEKEKNKEAIYNGFIRNRQPGDTSHISSDEESLRTLIQEEVSRDKFTVAAINNMNLAHVPYLRNNFAEWTRQLAHIYHYYIHGPNGNTNELSISEKKFMQINIEVKLYPGSNKPARVINLRDINDDMQTRYIRSAFSHFEFKATVEGTGIVEGVLRYHPFLYDSESFPLEHGRTKPDAEEDDQDFTVSEARPARGRRPIFECYWNGRLIPYTFIDELDWCTAPKKPKSVPLECYNRVSGVLWTNDKFQVSTNKLTFIDLEVKLKEKHTAYLQIVGKNEKRTDIAKEFTSWLKECHEAGDKQILFHGPLGSLHRPELPRNKQAPWSTFEEIDWSGSTYKKGQLVRIIRTVPFFLGTIRRFILYGEHSSDVFATGGEVELQQQPSTLYDTIRVVPLSKLDRHIEATMLRNIVYEEEAKLPDVLFLSWPEGFEVQEGDVLQVGQVIGDMRVEIRNRKGESISKLPGSQAQKLLVELKVIWQSGRPPETVIQHVCQHGKTWPYWFKRMAGVLRRLGDYKILFQAVLNEAGSSVYCGRSLPLMCINFKMIEGEADKFGLGMLDGQCKIGQPFNLPIDFQDEFGHPTHPPEPCTPVLSASGLTLTYEKLEVKNSQIIVTGVTATGTVKSSQGENFQLSVTVEGMKKETQSMKIRMLPGTPHQLFVAPEGETELENGKETRFEVEVRDVSGNLCAMPKLTVNCKFIEVSSLPVYHVDVSNSGKGSLKAGPVQLDKLKENQTITAKLELQGDKTVAPVERVIKLLPSNRTAELRLFYTSEDEEKELAEGTWLERTAGSMLEILTFKIYDEAGREKAVDDSLAGKIKVNWSKASRDLLRQNQLPPVKVPTNITEFKYCLVTLHDGSGQEASFTIKSIPGPPASLKVTCKGQSKFRNGEKLPGYFTLSIKDTYGNDIGSLKEEDLKDLKVTCDGLKIDKLVKELDGTSGFTIKNFEFEPSLPIGSREISICWRENLKEYFRIEILPGPPVKITVPDWDLSQPITVYNENALPQRMVCQLCDTDGNASYQDNAKIQIAKDRALMLSPAPEPHKVDQKGRADFGVFTVSAKPGVYHIQPKGFIGHTTLLGPKIKVCIQPDSTRAARVILEAAFASNVFKPGEVLPVLSCSIHAEDESPLQGAKSAWLHLRQTCVSSGQLVALHPDSRPKQDTSANFAFSDRHVPTESGEYSYEAVYGDPKSPSTRICSDKLFVRVTAGTPVRLEPNRDPGTPTVSNTKSQACRVLIKQLVLLLKDEYGNTAGADLSGKIHIEIVAIGEAVNELPVLVGGIKKLTLPIVNGQCVMSSVAVQENCPGRDGASYLLRCTANISELPRNQQLPPFDIGFFFYNDVRKQQQMIALTKEHDNVKTAIATYKSLFLTAIQLISELTFSVNEAKEEETHLKAELKKHNVSVANLGALLGIDTLIQGMEKERNQLLKKPRRICGLHPALEDPHVIGKIGALAQVEDESVARVLSWHMSADMDCVVTLTTAKAKEVYKLTSGKQQVLPLDSIFKKTLPEWSKPLPHERIRQGWRPTGRPVFARNCLVFPKHKEHCQTVFGMLLGDTVMLDTLDDANIYRQEIVKHTHCPTILTRDGERIRSNGKFGGLMNKALPIEKLRGAVFAAPVPSKYHELTNNISLLQSYKQAVERRQQAEAELNEQKQQQNTPEMRAKYKECADAEGQLRLIEERLGLNSAVALTTGKNRKRSAEHPLVSPPSSPPTGVTSPSGRKKKRPAENQAVSPMSSPTTGVTSPSGRKPARLTSPGRSPKKEKNPKSPASSRSKSPTANTEATQTPSQPTAQAPSSDVTPARRSARKRKPIRRS